MTRRVHHTFSRRDTRGALTFSSKAEARAYDELRLMERAGEIVMLLRQVPFRLPGGVVYWADFMAFMADGSVRVIDAKAKRSPRTREYIMKKKLVEAQFPITIEEMER